MTEEYTPTYIIKKKTKKKLNILFKKRNLIANLSLIVLQTNIYKMSDFRICPETGVKIDKDMIIGCISDTFKSINGIRPRWMYEELRAMSFDQLGDYLTDLQEQENEEWKREVKWEREQRKMRKKREKRYQKIRTAAKSVPPQDTYSLGDVLQGIL